MKYLNVFIMSTCILIGGCVGLQQEETLKDIKTRLTGIENAQIKTRAGLEELNNKLSLLQEQTAVNKKNVDELKKMAFPVMPPDELKVISLDAESINKATNEDDSTKKIFVNKTEETNDPEALYTEAQNLFLSGRFTESSEHFSRFIQNYPKHSLADNAQYWIGEIYYSQKDFQKAADEFQKVVDIYPNGNKTPDALLKVAFSYLEQNEKIKASNALSEVIRKFPTSEAASKAKNKLQEIQK